MTRRYTCLNPGCRNIIEDDPSRPGPARMTCSDSCRQAVYRQRQWERNKTRREATVLRGYERVISNLVHRHPDLADSITRATQAIDYLAACLESKGPDQTSI